MSIAKYLAGILVFAFALAGCAQNAGDAPLPPTSDTVSDGATPQEPLTPVRVIVKFKQDVPFQSDAFLRALQLQTKARLPVRYISSVFSDTHVYSFAPPGGESYAQMLQRISAMPEVSFARIDQAVQAH